MKNLKYVFCFLFFAFITGCNGAEKNPKIELPEELQGCLISTELFEDEWDWEDSSIYFDKFEPIATNQYKSSVIVTQIDRLSKDGIHRFDFATGLVTYEKPITLSFTLENNLSQNDVELHPEFLKVSGEMKYFCGVTFSAKKYYGYGCQIQIIYKYHIFNMTHWGNSFVDIKTLEDFLNPYLIQFDSCIVDLEK